MGPIETLSIPTPRPPSHAVPASRSFLQLPPPLVTASSPSPPLPATRGTSTTSSPGSTVPRPAKRMMSSSVTVHRLVHTLSHWLYSWISPRLDSWLRPRRDSWQRQHREWRASTSTPPGGGLSRPRPVPVHPLVRGSPCPLTQRQACGDTVAVNEDFHSNGQQ